MKALIHTGIWLAVLVGGVLTVGFVFRITCQGGTGNGAGYFDYYFRSLYFPAFDGDSSISRVEIEGRVPGRFKIFGGVSPIYDAVSMNWSLNAGYEGWQEGHVLLDLDNNTIINENGDVPLDMEHLLDLMGIPDRPSNRVTLQHLLNFFEDCHTGDLPRPSHHGYILEDPMPGRLQHVALGYMLGYPALTWVGIWIVAIPLFYMKKRTRIEPEVATP